MASVGGALNAIFGGGSGGSAPEYQMSDEDIARYKAQQQYADATRNVAGGQASNAYDYGRADRMSALGSADRLGDVGAEYQRYLSGQAGPSRAELLSRAMGDQNAANAYAMAASQRGGPTAASNRAALLGGVNSGVQTSANIAQLRAQEQEAARQGMLGAYGAQGQMYGNLRGQDAQLYSAAAQRELGQQQASDRATHGKTDAELEAYKARVGAQSALQGQNADRNSIFGFAGGSNWSDEELKTNITDLGSKGAWSKYTEPSATSKLSDASDTVGQLKSGSPIGRAAGLAGLVKGIAALSDKDAKKDVDKGSAATDDELRDLLRSIRPVAFDYKDESLQPGKGRNVGVIAQDVERAKVGPSLVIDTPKGKMLSAPQVAAASLAASADLNSRLEVLEKRLGRGRAA